jgi:hypothetical protein
LLWAAHPTAQYPALNADVGRLTVLPDKRLRDVADLLKLQNTVAAVGPTYFHSGTGKNSAVDGIWACPRTLRHWGVPEPVALQAYWTAESRAHKVGERLTDHLTVGVALPELGAVVLWRCGAVAQQLLSWRCGAVKRWHWKQIVGVVR